MAHSKHLWPPAQGVSGVAIATEENLRLGAVPWFRNSVNAMAGGTSSKLRRMSAISLDLDSEIKVETT